MEDQTSEIVSREDESPGVGGGSGFAYYPTEGGLGVRQTN